MSIKLPTVDLIKDSLTKELSNQIDDLRKEPIKLSEAKLDADHADEESAIAMLVGAGFLKKGKKFVHPKSKECAEIAPNGSKVRVNFTKK